MAYNLYSEGYASRQIYCNLNYSAGISTAVERKTRFSEQMRPKPQNINFQIWYNFWHFEATLLYTKYIYLSINPKTLILRKVPITTIANLLLVQKLNIVLFLNNAKS
jgi:hypothetical protein